MKICIINFSGRHNGNCNEIAELIEQTKYADHEVSRYDMYALDITPCGKCGYTCFEDSTSCPYISDGVYRIYSSICSSELVFYIVPNYCDYPNAYFFTFNERSQCFFQNNPDTLEQYLHIIKKFMVISNTEEGNFRDVFNYHINDSSVLDILFLSARSFGLDSIRGGLIESTKAKQIVEGYISQ